MKKFVKVWTEGEIDTPSYKIKGSTDDGRTYILNLNEWKRSNEN